MVSAIASSFAVKSDRSLYYYLILNYFSKNVVFPLSNLIFNKEVYL